MFPAVAARPFRQVALSVALSALACTAGATAVTIDFEGAAFVRGSSVGSTVAGVTFSNDVVAQAGVDLNEIDFPPRSGVNALLDAGGPIRIEFSTGVFSAGAYLTYGAPIQLEAFDASGASLGQVNSLHATNFASDPGSVPNEWLELVDAGGRIASIVFTGDPAGLSFALDDLTFDAGNVVPEPQSLLLVAAALAGLAAGRRRRC